MKILSAFYIVLLLVFACKLTPKATLEAVRLDICRDQISTSSCNYYDCMESQYQCGPSGYPIGYGKYYCQKFKNFCDGTLTSSMGQKWVKGTTECLKAEIARRQTDFRKCSDISDYAFATHSFCYTDGGVAYGGASFCSLGPLDWIAITHCVSLGDRLSQLGVAQIEMTARRCGQFFLGGGLFLDDDGAAENAKLDIETAKMIKSMSEPEREARAQEFFDFADKLRKSK